MRIDPGTPVHIFSQLHHQQCPKLVEAQIMVYTATEAQAQRLQHHLADCIEPTWRRKCCACNIPNELEDENISLTNNHNN